MRSSHSTNPKKSSKGSKKSKKSSKSGIPTDRKLEIIKLNPNIKPISNQSSLSRCSEHPNTPALFFNQIKNVYQCDKCACKDTLTSNMMSLASTLTKEEFKKKSKSDAFLRRLQFYQVCLNGHLERNERILNESIQRHEHSLNHINVFFEYISGIFSEVHMNLLNEKNVNIEEIKSEHYKKKTILVKNIKEVSGFENDVSKHYENIILGMDIEKFNDIIDKYTTKVDEIQQFCEQNELENYPVYKEVVENARSIEDITKILQKCVGKLYSVFNSAEKDNLSSEDDEDGEFGEGGSAEQTFSVDVDSMAMNDEISRINECFYSNTMKEPTLPSKEEDDDRVPVFKFTGHIEEDRSDDGDDESDGVDLREYKNNSFGVKEQLKSAHHPSEDSAGGGGAGGKSGGLNMFKMKNSVNNILSKNHSSSSRRNKKKSKRKKYKKLCDHTSKYFFDSQLTEHGKQKIQNRQQKSQFESGSSNSNRGKFKLLKGLRSDTKNNPNKYVHLNGKNMTFRSQYNIETSKSHRDSRLQSPAKHPKNNNKNTTASRKNPFLNRNKSRMTPRQTINPKMMKQKFTYNFPAKKVYQKNSLTPKKEMAQGLEKGRFSSKNFKQYRDSSLNCKSHKSKIGIFEGNQQHQSKDRSFPEAAESRGEVLDLGHNTKKSDEENEEDYSDSEGNGHQQGNPFMLGSRVKNSRGFYHQQSTSVGKKANDEERINREKRRGTDLEVRINNLKRSFKNQQKEFKNHKSKTAEFWANAAENRANYSEKKSKTAEFKGSFHKTIGEINKNKNPLSINMTGASGTWKISDLNKKQNDDNKSLLDNSNLSENRQPQQKQEIPITKIDTPATDRITKNSATGDQGAIRDRGGTADNLKNSQKYSSLVPSKLSTRINISKFNSKIGKSPKPHPKGPSKRLSSQPKDLEARLSETSTHLGIRPKISSAAFVNGRSQQESDLDDPRSNNSAHSNRNQPLPQPDLIYGPSGIRGSSGNSNNYMAKSNLISSKQSQNSSSVGGSGGVGEGRFSDGFELNHQIYSNQKFSKRMTGVAGSELRQGQESSSRASEFQKKFSSQKIEKNIVLYKNLNTESNYATGPAPGLSSTNKSMVPASSIGDASKNKRKIKEIYIPRNKSRGKNYPQVNLGRTVSSQVSQTKADKNKNYYFTVNINLSSNYNNEQQSDTGKSINVLRDKQAAQKSSEMGQSPIEGSNNQQSKNLSSGEKKKGRYAKEGVGRSKKRRKAMNNSIYETILQSNGLGKGKNAKTASNSNMRLGSNFKYSTKSGVKNDKVRSNNAMQLLGHKSVDLVTSSRGQSAKAAVTYGSQILK